MRLAQPRALDLSGMLARHGVGRHFERVVEAERGSTWRADGVVISSRLAVSLEATAAEQIRRARPLLAHATVMTMTQMHDLPRT